MPCTSHLCPPDVSDWHLTLIKYWCFEVCIYPEIELNFELAFTSFLVQKLHIKQHCASVEICVSCLLFVPNDGLSPSSCPLCEICWSVSSMLLICWLMRTRVPIIPLLFLPFWLESSLESWGYQLQSHRKAPKTANILDLYQGYWMEVGAISSLPDLWEK